MKTGLIIHSHTGNTFSVGKKIAEALEGAGHTARLERISAKNESTHTKRANVEFEAIPDAAAYDLVVFGAPVWGFSLSPVMLAYLSLLPDMSGKKVCCFVTQQLSRPWMGGNHAVSQMVRALEEKGAVVVKTGIINWSNPAREARINKLAADFCSL